MRFDPAWFTSGLTASTAAAEDGVVEPGEPVPNDNYRIDEGHRLLTYVVAPHARVTVLTRHGNPAQFGATRITVPQLAQLVRGREARRGCSSRSTRACGSGCTWTPSARSTSSTSPDARSGLHRLPEHGGVARPAVGIEGVVRDHAHARPAEPRVEALASSPVTVSSTRSVLPSDRASASACSIKSCATPRRLARAVDEELRDVGPVRLVRRRR